MLLDRHLCVYVPVGDTLEAKKHFYIRGYEFLRCNVTPNIRARGGVAIFLSNTYPARRIPLATPLQAVVISSLHPLKMTFYCLYLPNSE